MDIRERDDLEMRKRKVAIFLHNLQQYRVPILVLLAERYDITVYCENAGDYEGSSLPLNVCHRNIKKLGPFYIHTKNIIPDCKKADVVLTLWNIRCLDFLVLGFMYWRSFKLIYWGIGTSGSYTRKFGSKSFITTLRNLMGLLADANIVYSSFPVSDLEAAGIDRKRIFVANNTVANLSLRKPSKGVKNGILFLGSLYKEKGIDELISSYHDVYSELGSNMPHLDIVGDGYDIHRLRSMVKELNLRSNITFHGSIFDDETLAKYFDRAIVCVSPRQAGLSVLKAMSFGVCFVTSHDAITGGEILNITDRKTGILYHTKADLSAVLREAALSPERLLGIGNEARLFYKTERSPEQMAGSISNAIDSVECVNS